MGPERRFAEEVARKRHARAGEDRDLWYWLGMFGLVGWAVALPTLLGIAVGLWLDTRWPAGQVSWTLTFLFVGAVAGAWNAWRWVRRDGEGDSRRP